MPSILWAGKKKQTTQAKHPVRLILTIKTTNYNYEITCGLPKPSLSMFTLDPEVKTEQVWFRETKRPSTTIIE